MRDLAGLAALFTGISFVLPWARLQGSHSASAWY